MKRDRLADVNLDEGSSLWKDARRRLFQNKMAVFGLCVFSLITLLSFVGPSLLPYDHESIDLPFQARPPLSEKHPFVCPNHEYVHLYSEDENCYVCNTPLEPAATQPARHLMGTDKLGRDLCAAVLRGGRVSLAVGFMATAVSLVIGVIWGAVAGYFGGRVDQFLMRIVDVLYALPFLIFVVLLMVMFGRNFLLLFFAIGFVEWLTMSRIVRAQVMALKNQEFVEASVALGYGRARIIFRHLFPNLLGPVIIYTTLTVPAVMLLESVLSFLGLGVQAPDTSWGVLIKQGAEGMEDYPWLLLFPAAFFSLTLFSLNFIGDGLRDALDPKSSKD